MKLGVRRTGEFYSIGMITPQQDEILAFFGELFNWTHVEIPGVDPRAHVGGCDVGGLFDLDGTRTSAGTPPLIGVMLNVETSDVVSAKVAALGGVSEPAIDVMEQRRMADCCDSNGAAYDAWEPKKTLGTDVDARTGALCWFETITTNVDRAGDLYSGLFGWTMEVKPMPGPITRSSNTSRA